MESLQALVSLSGGCVGKELLDWVRDDPVVLEGLVPEQGTALRILRDELAWLGRT